MSGSRVVVCGMLAMALGGCASASRKDMARLQSQLGLLDERVTQLERSGSTSASAPTASLAEPITDVGTALGTTTQPEHNRSSGSHHGVKSSAKYSTREVQQALKNAGFYQGSIDGKMGASTRDAIKEFQHAHGLKEDGVVGKKTWAKLSAYTELSSSTTASTPAASTVASSASSTTLTK